MIAVSFQSSSSFNCTLSPSSCSFSCLCPITCQPVIRLRLVWLSVSPSAQRTQRKRQIKSFTQIIGTWQMHLECSSCCCLSQAFSPDKSFSSSFPLSSSRHLRDATEKYWNLKKLGLLHQKEPILSIGHEFSLQQADQSPGYHAYYYSHHPHQSFTRHQQVYPEIEGRSVSSSSSSSKYSSPSSSSSINSNDKKADRNHFKSQAASSSSSGELNFPPHSGLHV